MGNAPILRTDSFGLEWIIEREGKEWAECCREDPSDTLEDLAKKIGLDFESRDEWLRTRTEEDRQVFMVPNTILAVWAGDVNLAWKWKGKKGNFSLGKVAVRWNSDTRYLKRRGFKVEEIDIHKSNRSSQNVVDQVRRYTQSAWLHGVFFWGHGGPEHFGTGDNSWVVRYKDVVESLQYDLGFVLINACFSDHEHGDENITYWHPSNLLGKTTIHGPIEAGGRDLVAKTPNARFEGAKGILSPFQRLPFLRVKLPNIPFEAHHHPADILKPGEQGTDTWKLGDPVW